MTLSVEAGPGVTFEKVGGITDDYFSISAAEKYTWSINENTEFKQSLSAILDPSNSDNYSLATDAQLNLKISAMLSWQITATWTYDNAPAVDRGKDDTTVSTGISLKF
jgi:putative salt-induced outer membrane protein YdiY